MTDPQIKELVDQLLKGEIDAHQAEEAIVARLAEGARAVDKITEMVHGLVAGIEEFKGVTGHSGPITSKLLKIARRRFTIQVSAAMMEEPIPEDTQSAATTSVQRLRSEVAQLADRVAELVETTIRDSQIRKELEIAGTVQQMLVPSDAVAVGGLLAYAWFRPADECSGDWWSFAKLGKTDAFMVVGDVTGHGAPAAIVAATAKGALDMARVGMRTSLKPFMALNMLNHILIDNMRGEYFMTGLVARFQTDNNTVRIANAGHRAPWILRQGEEGLVVTGQRSPPLGSSRRAKYTDEVIQLRPGDVVIAFTDGIPECESEDGQQFGERTLRDVCERALPEGPEAICAAVRQAVEKHVGSLSRLDDDVTLLAIQVPR